MHKDMRAWEKLVRAVNKNPERRIAIGIRDSELYPPGNTSRRRSRGPIPVAEIAMIHEQGRGVPRRPFLTMAREEIIRRGGPELAREIDPKKLNFKLGGDGRVGRWAVYWIQKKIDELMTPGNAPKTVKIKGFNDPLIHTRKLRRSFDWWRLPDKER